MGLRQLELRRAGVDLQGQTGVVCLQNLGRRTWNGLPYIGKDGAAWRVQDDTGAPLGNGAPAVTDLLGFNPFFGFVEFWADCWGGRWCW